MWLRFGSPFFARVGKDAFGQAPVVQAVDSADLAKDSGGPHGPQDQYHMQGPTRTKMLPTNNAERASKLEKQTSNTVVRNESSQ